MVQTISTKEAKEMDLGEGEGGCGPVGAAAYTSQQPGLKRKPNLEIPALCQAAPGPKSAVALAGC